jgi:hypothetical protein
MSKFGQFLAAGLQHCGLVAGEQWRDAIWLVLGCARKAIKIESRLKTRHALQSWRQIGGFVPPV